jgi:hypothetical protein
MQASPSVSPSHHPACTWPFTPSPPFPLHCTVLRCTAGKYDLIGILTHKGRSADSGHYVSWVRQEDGQWVQFDDDKMILRKDEEVLTLSGAQGIGGRQLWPSAGAQAGSNAVLEARGAKQRR